jgi:cell division septation protein DedD
MRGQRDESSGVELHLDNRQVFLLFFASAVILSLVFTLGVVVGKRAERQVVPEPGADPLTLLDQMGGRGEKGDENLSFHEALGTPPKPPAAAEADAGAGTTDEVKPTQEPPAPAAAPAALAKAAPEKAAAEKKGEKKAEKKKAVKEKKGEKEKAVAKNEAKPDPENGGGEGTYSLQLSAFQDRHEAHLFMKKLREGGLEPYMVATTIPGRGVWYRVRLGRYKTWDEALAAKQEFERTQKIIAYVAKN